MKIAITISWEYADQRRGGVGEGGCCVNRQMSVQLVRRKRVWAEVVKTLRFVHQGEKRGCRVKRRGTVGRMPARARGGGGGGERGGNVGKAVHKSDTRLRGYVSPSPFIHRSTEEGGDINREGGGGDDPVTYCRRAAAAVQAFFTTATICAKRGVPRPVTASHPFDAVHPSQLSGIAFVPCVTSRNIAAFW